MDRMKEGVLTVVWMLEELDRELARREQLERTSQLPLIN